MFKWAFREGRDAAWVMRQTLPRLCVYWESSSVKKTYGTLREAADEAEILTLKHY